MSNIAVKVEHLSKMYRLGVINSGLLFRDIQTWIALKRGKEDPHSKIGSDKYKGDKDHFWALKDISFDVKQGERVGIIGKNGAGKSTLLKLLSRISAPTEGVIKIKGKIASLLEVGTGFHAELTGRENIFLNGAILGMKKRQIEKKLDSIVDFSGIEHHIDTPVKRYSSGMYVRLAFAVAAHLDSEILIADEVLAVGDAEFQKKALGKMQDLSTGEGRTVFFVSHNMNAVENLCNCGILLNEGRIVSHSKNINEIIKKYLVPENSSFPSFWKNEDNKYNNLFFTPLEFFIGDSSGNKLSMPIKNNNDFYVHIICNIQNYDNSIEIGYELYNEDGYRIYASYFNDDKQENWVILKHGNNHLFSKIPKYFLNEGLYRIEITSSLYKREWICEPENNSPYIYFEIKGGLSESPYHIDKRPCILAPFMQWYIKN